MRLIFVLKFISSGYFGEVTEKYDVLAHHDLEEVMTTAKLFRDCASAFMLNRFPDPKERANASIHQDEGGTELDPNFQVIDGSWSYYVEPLVEYSTEDLRRLRDLRTPAMNLMAQGWELVRKANRKNLK